MRPKNRKKIIFSGMILAMLIVLLSGWGSYWSNNKLLGNQIIINKNQTIVYQVEKLVSNISDAETGQRGFVITGKWSYLGPYYSGITAVHRILRDLQELTGDDPLTQQNLLDLGPLIDQRCEQFYQNISIRKNQGLSEAVASISTDAGKDVMENIRKLGSEIQTRALKRYHFHFKQSEHMARQSMQSIIGGYLLASLLLLLAIYQISRERKERNAIEADKERLILQSISQDNLATIGEVATGMAHEINQPLSYIKIIFESTLQDVTSRQFNEDELVENCRESLKQITRISEIINHLRTFGRSEVLDFKDIDLATVLNNSLILFRQRFKVEKITYKLNIQENLPYIYGNEGKLEQVFINFFKNSIDSLDGREDGEIEIAIYAKEKNVEVRFTDNGSGIPDKIKEKIFEPFFTTKEVGKGTGLGLSIVYGIIKEHNGNIKCLDADCGTAFLVTFPA